MSFSAGQVVEVGVGMRVGAVVGIGNDIVHKFHIPKHTTKSISVYQFPNKISV